MPSAVIKCSPPVHLYLWETTEKQVLTGDESVCAGSTSPVLGSAQVWETESTLANLRRNGVIIDS